MPEKFLSGSEDEDVVNDMKDRRINRSNSHNSKVLVCYRLESVQISSSEP
jgi:hypothetical protein